MVGKFFHNCITLFSCLAIALFAMANKPCYADDITHYVSFSCFDSYNDPIYAYTNEIGDLYTYIDFALDYRSDLNLSSHSTQLKQAISDIGLSSYFTNWSPYYPNFYPTLYYTNRNGFNVFYFSFFKYNPSLSDFSVSYNTPSYYAVIDSPYGFLPLRDHNFITGFRIGSSGGSNFNSVNYDTDFFGVPVSYSADVELWGTTVSIYNGNTGFSSSFSNFLSDPNQYVFDLFIVFSSDWTNLNCASYHVNGDYRMHRRDVSPSSYFCFPIFSMINIFDFGVSLGYVRESLFGGDYLSVMKYYWNTSYPLDLELDLYCTGLTVSGISPSNPTPTPMPSPTSIPPWRDSELPTPTAYPSVSLAPLPTGIVTDYIPLLDLPSSSSTLSNITGIIKEFNSVFSRKVFALGSYTLQVMYYFSGWFKFIFLVPAGVFIAFLIGRLRKK